MGSGAVRGARSMMGVRGAKESGASRFRRIRGLRESRGSEAANRVRGDEICSEDAILKYFTFFFDFVWCFVCVKRKSI